MKLLSKNNHILVPALAFLALVAFLPGLAGADFQVAYTGSVEEKPAVAYNSQTGKFLVAYLIETGGHYELRCQLHNADGTKSGGVLQPFLNEPHAALGRPAIAYSPNSNRFLVTAPVTVTPPPQATGPVMFRFLNGDGSNFRVSPRSALPPPPPPATGVDPYSRYYDGDGVGSLHVVHNSIYDTFLITVQRTIPDKWVAPYDHRNIISAMHISYLLSGPVVQLVDCGLNGISSHAVAHAPIPTNPIGGRYLFASSEVCSGVGLLDNNLNTITSVPLYMGKPEGGSRNPDIAFGPVDGKNVFLLVYSDDDNCRPPNDTCSNLNDQWTGVWGTYVDPLVTSYGTSPNNTPFPISFIWSHLANRREYKPRVAHNPSAEAFFVVWRESPFEHPNNDESRSHIRGNTVDYYVPDGLYDTSLVPLPASDSNVVISDVTGTCSPGSLCLSNEDPTFPDVAANNPAVIVWHQKYPFDITPPFDMDVLGDFFSDFDYPAGDELAADFGTNGLWHYDGASWSKLTTWNPDDDLTGWSGGLAVDFGGDGLWNHDGTSWSQKTSWNPGSGGLAGWSGGLAVDFDADGLWVYDGTFWSKKTSWNPDNLGRLERWSGRGFQHHQQRPVEP